MGHYIIEEFNAGRKTALARIYLIGIFALCLLSNVAVIAFRSIYGNNEGTFAYNIMTYATWCFFIPYYSCILIADMVFGKEYPNKDNNVMLREGMSPTKVYLVKLLASILLALAFLVVTLVAFLGITMIFHFSEGSIGLYEIKDFFEKMLYAVPLWLAGIGISNMFLFMFDKGGKLKAYLCYLGLTGKSRAVTIYYNHPRLRNSFHFVNHRSYIHLPSRHTSCCNSPDRSQSDNTCICTSRSHPA